MSIRKFRDIDGLWDQASVKASGEGTTVSALIREWLSDYVNNGRARSAVVLTSGEREAVTEALTHFGPTFTTMVIDAINKERSNGGGDGG